MAENLTVKLGADTSEFRGKIQAAANSVGNSLGTQAGTSAGGKFVSAFQSRLLGAREISTALATALGLNIENIAQNIARFITGVSKEEEENLNRLAMASDKLTDATKRNMQDQLSDQDLYRAKITELGQLKNKLASNEAKTTKDQADAMETQIAIQEKELEIRKLGNSLRDKGFEEDLKWFHIIQNIKEEDRKKAEEANKQEGEENLRLYKQRVSQEKELHDLKMQALSPEERVNVLQKERLDLERKIAQLRRDGADTLTSEIELAKIDAQIRSDTLDIEKDITKEKKEQQKITMTASGDLGVVRAIGGFRRYNDPADQKDYEKQLIESAKRDTDSEIAMLQAQIDAYTRSGSTLGKYELPALQQRIKALRGRENNLQDFVFNPKYQDAAGEGLFRQQVKTIGDPLQLLGEQGDTLKEIGKGITDINTRLHSAGFTTDK